MGRILEHAVKAYQYIFNDFVIKDICVREPRKSPRGTPWLHGIFSVLMVSRFASKCTAVYPKGGS